MTGILEAAGREAAAFHGIQKERMLPDESAGNQRICRSRPVENKLIVAIVFLAGRTEAAGIRSSQRDFHHLVLRLHKILLSSKAAVDEDRELGRHP